MCACVRVYINIYIYIYISIRKVLWANYAECNLHSYFDNKKKDVTLFLKNEGISD